MFGLGWPEVAIIVIVAILIFGPKKIPELGSTFGKTLRGFKEGLNQAEEEQPEQDEDYRS
ncbi:twin-arginine translocase TatA/TatE family subunit [Leptothermofonsia sichuanensis E412]|jgi:sec-independent protein translocase protein TatA|uniref:twin-arginine translocase TatA/TatE family subunit n=1 Tax=Leptothermofonsia sichuanensis TaxID=2917832 RepID=UPI001CA743DD|nr:twin-arginine translocase TatA/TatE family subunit [Leptothermofonsia sichuanensis]QZZ19750.1 twin-arginine translocase TatA/TatE family subunit [Leptothermofonsia sichuanensis E412]